jgi:hypothetical protein
VSEALCNFCGAKLGFTHICANVAVPNELQSLRDERDRLRTFLDEALEEWEYSCQYKSEYLREKHGDLERIAEIKAALTPAGQRWTPQERYLHDPMFKNLVDMLEAAIHRADYTPSELREAAVLAAIHYESMRVRRQFIPLTPNEATE